MALGSTSSVNVKALEAALAELQPLLGSRVTTSDVQREHHSHGESYHLPAAPDIVCFPQNTAEVSEILKISARHQIPVIPFGAGTSVEGHVNALRGGIAIDLREMNKVLRVSVEDCDATVEAGVTRMQLVKALNNTGLTFFVDPGADATIGGMSGTRASGTTTVRYGTMRENVLGLTVVLADGRVIKTGSRARKSSAGYMAVSLAACAVMAEDIKAPMASNCATGFILPLNRKAWKTFMRGPASTPNSPAARV